MWNRLNHHLTVKQLFRDMAWTAARAGVMFCSGDCGRAGIRPDGSLGEAGVGAACAAVFPLAALHHAGDLQACHYRKTPIPNLQEAAHQQAVFF